MTHTPTMHGFTMIELVMVLSLIGIVAVGGLSFQRFLAANGNIRSSGQSVVVALRQAQTRASAMAADDSWAVHVASRAATVFQGTAYDARDVSADYVIEFGAPVEVNGTTDIVFPKGGMVPVGIVSVSLRFHTGVVSIHGNEEGMIRYAY